MRNFFYRVSGAIARFMYGRNGTDQLNAALLAAYLLVWLVQILLHRNFTVRMALEAVSLVLAALVLAAVVVNKMAAPGMLLPFMAA